jgi:hypothetical protein
MHVQFGKMHVLFEFSDNQTHTVNIFNLLNKTLAS